jgi:hypothetical protein
MQLEIMSNKSPSTLTTRRVSAHLRFRQIRPVIIPLAGEAYGDSLSLSLSPCDGFYFLSSWRNFFAMPPTDYYSMLSQLISPIFFTFHIFLSHVQYNIRSKQHRNSMKLTAVESEIIN